MLGAPAVVKAWRRALFAMESGQINRATFKALLDCYELLSDQPTDELRERWILMTEALARIYFWGEHGEQQVRMRFASSSAEEVLEANARLSAVVLDKTLPVFQSLLVANEQPDHATRLAWLNQRLCSSD